MFPTIEAGGLRLNTYVLMWGIAILAAGLVAFWRLARRGLAMGAAATVVLAAIAGGLLLQPLGAWLLGWRAAASRGQAVMLRPGMNMPLFICGIVLGGGLARLFARIPLLNLLDATALALPIAEALGRIGCLGAGCCYGRVADPGCWLALYLPDSAGQWAARYPTQILSSLGALGVSVLVLGFEAWRRRVHPADWPFPGFLGLLTLFLFGAQRIVVECLRADPALLGPLHLGHIMGGVLCMASGACMVWQCRRHGRQIASGNG